MTCGLIIFNQIKASTNGDERGNLTTIVDKTTRYNCKEEGCVRYSTTVTPRKIIFVSLKSG